MSIHLPLVKLRWIALFIGLALLTVFVEMAVVRSAAFSQRAGQLAPGVIFDLIVGIPLLFYLFVVRRFGLSIRSLLFVLGGAMVVTMLILPRNQFHLIGLLRNGLLVVELTIAGYVLTQIRHILRHYRQLQAINPDFVINMQASLDTVLGRTALNRILVSELSVLRYSLFGWWAPVEKIEADSVFTTYRKSGQVALTVGIILVGLIETAGIHLLINRWNPTAAWIATLVGLYGLLFLVADLTASVKRPVLVRNDHVLLRFGLRGQVYISKEHIKRVDSIRDKPTPSPETMNGTLLSTPNVLLTLWNLTEARGPLGSQRSVRRIALFVDDKDEFIDKLTA
ncbi:hypothetical protein [Spirosoma agri]|uniref:Uncharacterized protein n=1 Tax=Spirosoma agri TaxID=1987381 RepID=A0A6M0IDQ4_9BACT|nr:hypothetical protein [Spirosoma agri]NEU65885.1 hypothetical protein [Spirosoma agri]